MSVRVQILIILIPPSLTSVRELTSYLCFYHSPLLHHSFFSCSRTFVLTAMILSLNFLSRCSISNNNKLHHEHRQLVNRGANCCFGAEHKQRTSFPAATKVPLSAAEP